MLNTGFYSNIKYRVLLMVCCVDKLYGSNNYVYERHRHRYEVNPEKIDDLTKAGMFFVGKDETGMRMEILELKGLCF